MRGTKRGTKRTREQSRPVNIRDVLEHIKDMIDRGCRLVEISNKYPRVYSEYEAAILSYKNARMERRLYEGRRQPPLTVWIQGWGPEERDRASREWLYHQQAFSTHDVFTLPRFGDDRWGQYDYQSVVVMYVRPRIAGYIDTDKTPLDVDFLTRLMGWQPLQLGKKPCMAEIVIITSMQSPEEAVPPEKDPFGQFRALMATDNVLTVNLGGCNDNPDIEINAKKRIQEFLCKEREPAPETDGPTTHIITLGAGSMDGECIGTAVFSIDGLIRWIMHTARKREAAPMPKEDDLRRVLVPLLAKAAAGLPVPESVHQNDPARDKTTHTVDALAELIRAKVVRDTCRDRMKFGELQEVTVDARLTASASIEAWTDMGLCIGDE